MFEHFHAMPRMARSIRRHKTASSDHPSRVPRATDTSLTSAGLRQAGTAVGYQIADRDDFHIRVILETEIGAKLAQPIPTIPSRIFRSKPLSNLLPRLDRRRSSRIPGLPFPGQKRLAHREASRAKANSGQKRATGESS